MYSQHYELGPGSESETDSMEIESDPHISKGESEVQDESKRESDPRDESERESEPRDESERESDPESDTSDFGDKVAVNRYIPCSWSKKFVCF